MKEGVVFMCGWSNPNDNILRIRITEAQFADDFINYGRIKFNTPQSWIKYAEKHGDGRGDFYEGTLAFCDMVDIENILKLNKKYDSDNIFSINKRPIVKSLFKDRLLYKDKRALELPCYCLYILKVNAFLPPSEAGEQELTTVIDGSFFKDFADNRTVEQVEAMPEEQRPAMIIIKDFDSFRNRLVTALEGIGVSESDILIHYATYFDFDQYQNKGWMDFEQHYPKELFMKNKRFEKQSEARVVIKNRSPEVLQRLHEGIIDLGCMEDIAEVHKGYYPDGIEIHLQGLIVEQ